ncbi:MAG: PKD domain-containing protein [Candidatus Levybacteria bacterium]|nr:PKD domain-containing protein [Candidatus Levybacteria bacterium]
MASLSLIKKVILLMLIVVILVAIPLTVYVVQKQQELRSRAAPTTILSFDPSSKTANSSEVLLFKINVDPKDNQISFLKLSINYNPEFLKPAPAGSVCSNPQDSICPDKGNSNLQTVEGPILGGNNVAISMSITAATAKISSPITVAYVAFTPLKAGKTEISFAPPPNSQAFSVAGTDLPSENVLKTDSSTGAISSLPAAIEISSTALITPTPTLQPGAAAAANPPPVCDSLSVDRTASGNAPFSLNFTANGRKVNGTISKVSFNFGDGPIQDVIQGGGIGSSSVSVQTFHTYHNAGNFTASAMFTDNSGTANSPTSCTQTVTVKTAAGAIVTGTPTAGGTPGATITAGLTPIRDFIAAEISPTPRISPIAAPGPSETFLKIGILGGALSIVGAILLFAL